MSEPTCETCRFWRSLKGDDLEKGRCHRLPPTRTGEIGDAISHIFNGYEVPETASLLEILSMRIGTARGFISTADWAAWPETFSDDWCGEHQPRETEG